MNISLLKTLHNELWEEPLGNFRGYKLVRESSDRTLTEQEWAKVIAIIYSEKLLCAPSTGAFGFGYQIVIYSQARYPTYPGTEDAFEPEFLLAISDRHLGKMWGCDHVRDRFLAEVIEPLVYGRCSNVRAVNEAFGPLRDRSYYEY